MKNQYWYWYWQYQYIAAIYWFVSLGPTCTMLTGSGLIMILGGWVVGNFWTDNLKSKRFDGIKFWKFDKFFEWIEFIIENDFTGTSIVTIKSCREKNNRCIWFFRQSSHCKLNAQKCTPSARTKKFCANDKNALQSVILHWPYNPYCNMWQQICDTRDNLANLAHHPSF